MLPFACIIYLAKLKGGDAAGWTAEVAAVRARGEATSRGALAVTGNDLIASGIVTPGPRLGEVLETLLASVLDDPTLNVRETLLARARDAVRPAGA